MRDQARVDGEQYEALPKGALRLFAAAGAVLGAVAGLDDALSPTGVPIDLTADASGTVQHLVLALAMHVLPATAVGLAFGLLLSGLRRTPGVRSVSWGVLNAGAGLGLGAVAAFCGVQELFETSYLWHWLAAIVVSLGLTGAVAVREGRMRRVSGVPLAVGVIVGSGVFVAALRAMTMRLLPSAVWALAVAVGAAGLAGAAGAVVARYAAGAVGRIGSAGGRIAAAACAVAVVALLVAGAVRAYDEPVAWPGGSGGTASTADQERPSVVLISVDTLRADYVGYAGGPVRTPNIDSLAAESYTFEQAYSVAPWTRPSFASFFSSRYPSEMGVARSLGLTGAGADSTLYAWDTEAEMLAEIMNAAGYTTAAVVTNGNLTTAAHADQGFDLFRHVAVPPVPGDLRIGQELSRLRLLPRQLLTTVDDRERADEVTRVVEQAVGGAEGGPALIWVHYMDPHGPYDAPTAPEELRVYPGTPTVAGWANSSPEERQRIRDAYVAEVEFFDRWLRRLVAVLRSADLWDHSLIVLWSDHGEEFWEHGGWEHGQSLFNELLHVPLLIRLPGQREGHTIADPVSLLDVAPTVLELCGLDVPKAMHGRSIAPLISGQSALPDKRIWLEGCCHGCIRKGVLSGRYKLLYYVSAQRFELYDLRKDPGEHHNIHGLPHAPDTSAMEQDLLAWTEASLALMARRTGSGREQVPPAIMRRLKDMGYVQ
ncbi:MAG: sulfatase [Armatimonadota bacterium]|nr:sulfatase [Armatimonadota bacterium]